MILEADEAALSARGIFGGGKAGEKASKYVVSPRLRSARKLKEFGLNSMQRKSFYLGEQVIFEDPATGYPTATIFKLENNTLRAGIYDIVTDGSGALPSFLSRSKSLAGSLGVDNMEIFGADIQNERLASLLTRRGFSEGEPVLIDKFGFNYKAPIRHQHLGNAFL